MGITQCIVRLTIPRIRATLRAMRTLAVLAALVLGFAGCAGRRYNRARVVVTDESGGHRAAGTLVTKNLPGSGAPRLFLALPRSALEAMPGDTLLLPELTTPRQAIRESGWPLWRAHERRDAAMLPIRLYLDDHGRAVALESLEEGALKLPAPPAELMRLADEDPPR